MRCSKCNGRGQDLEDGRRNCHECGGDGEVPDSPPPRTPAEHRVVLAQLASSARDEETVRPAAEWALSVAAKAQKVRAAQKAYFRTRRGDDLIYSKRIERELDQLLDLAPEPVQLGLGLGGGA